MFRVETKGRTQFLNKEKKPCQGPFRFQSRNLRMMLTETVKNYGLKHGTLHQFVRYFCLFPLKLHIKFWKYFQVPSNKRQKATRVLPLHKKWSFPLTEEILNGKVIFLCNVTRFGQNVLIRLPKAFNLVVI